MTAGSRPSQATDEPAGAGTTATYVGTMTLALTARRDALPSTSRSPRCRP